MTKETIIMNLVRKVCYEEMQRDYGWSLNSVQESLSDVGFKTIDVKWINQEWPYEFMVTATIENEGFMMVIKSEDIK